MSLLVNGKSFELLPVQRNLKMGKRCFFEDYPTLFRHQRKIFRQALKFFLPAFFRSFKKFHAERYSAIKVKQFIRLFSKRHCACGKEPFDGIFFFGSSKKWFCRIVTSYLEIQVSSLEGF
ncbi:hypothetical protein BT96DRAFT_190784 [Gymnopus androsaceus JB14]|uniref:Uncharacterized protein n=1 Tax=Gymnopus androsaceus JB14 TaxID=1447944 RepID=A0A6A4IAM0_9AGAR|nr:hypothetical protein BT96DRAFT_190784 [Gymnopus androsaceus JB14]